MNWQPIETAPNDTRILFYSQGVVAIGSYFVAPNGVRLLEMDDLEHDDWMDGHPPAHWMPLPAPPK